MKKTIGNIFLANMKIRCFSVAMCLLTIGYQAVGASPTSSTLSSLDDILITSSEPENPEHVTINGKITDVLGGLGFVAVSLKGNAIMGTVSLIDGTFSMVNVPKNTILIFSYLGYKSVELDVSKMSEKQLSSISVQMEEDTEMLDEVVVAGAASQKKVSLVGSIASIAPSELRAPTRSLSTQLAGRVAGITFSQQSGQPGKDGASFMIRGINSVSGNTDPLILIDGLKRTIDDVDPNDIESFSILKDASATAVYGLEGANGIIVITTKNGSVASRPTVRVSYSTSINSSTFQPDWVGAVDYAKMRNEAYAVRGKGDIPFYSDDVIEKFGDNDMDTYPDIDWYDQLISQNNISQKGNFNISGGGSAISYYISAGFYQENGMFNSGEDGNANYSQFNFRSNIKADLTKSTTLALGFDGRYNTSTEPGQGVDNILGVINNINPTLFPHEFSNGEAPIEPSGVVNPWSLLRKTGFVKDYTNIMSTNLNVTQKLDFITSGLFVNGIVSFSKNNYNKHSFVKKYQQHAIDYENSHMGTGRDKDGNLVTINRTPNIDDKMDFVASPATGDRTVELQASLNYAKIFAGKLHTSLLLLYKQREYMQDAPAGEAGSADLLINALQAREQSIAGRITLDWDHRYFIDANVGYSGSQLFTPDKRWSSFPSIGIGWLVSNEEFWSESLSNVVDWVKVRATYGVVGAPGQATRFGYLATTGPKDGYTFGFGSAAGSGVHVPGVGETRLEQLGLTWERNRKINLGLEVGLFNSFKLIVEAYNYTNDKQLIKLNRLPTTLGLPAVPMANLGKMVSQGIDFDLTYSKNFGDFKINYIKGIVSYTENTIKENGELDPSVPYQSGIGLDWGRSLNYIALGLFKDQTEINESPVQNWEGSIVQPGDIKYKDIDGDGVITPKDRIYMGNKFPKWTFSLALDVSYKNFTLATRFIGKSNLFRTISAGRIPFNPYGTDGKEAISEAGGIYTVAMEDHWTPASYSGDPATENPNAEYPRLAYGVDNRNNSQPSSFWLRDASYLRWEDVELGYNWIPKSKASPFRNIYFYGRCDNILTFSKFKDWNPEQESSLSYPLKRTVSLGLEIGFNL